MKKAFLDNYQNRVEHEKYGCSATFSLICASVCTMRCLSMQRALHIAQPNIVTLHIITNFG